jgi:uncharacterized delta-60 repeat protein
MKTISAKLFSGLLILALMLGAAPTQSARAAAGAGQLDVSFNYGSGNGTNGTVYSLALQPDGKILVGGSFTSYNGDAGAPDNLLRLKTDGTLDATFNVGGAGLDGPVYALLRQADGNILVGGNFTAYNGNASAPDNILRLDANGSLDAGFSGAVAGASSSVWSFAIQPADNKILVGGTFTSYNGLADAPDRILRLNTDGSLDTTFN